MPGWWRKRFFFFSSKTKEISVCQEALNAQPDPWSYWPHTLYEIWATHKTVTGALSDLLGIHPAGVRASVWIPHVLNTNHESFLLCYIPHENPLSMYWFVRSWGWVNPQEHAWEAKALVPPQECSFELLLVPLPCFCPFLSFYLECEHSSVCVKGEVNVSVCLCLSVCVSVPSPKKQWVG